MSENQIYNVGFRFLEVADNCPEHPAIIAEDMTVTYANLAASVRAFAVKLRENGVGRNSIVVLETTDMLASLGIFLATAVLGGRFAIASTSLSRAGIFEATHLVATREAKIAERAQATIVDSSWSPRYVLAEGLSCDLDEFEGYEDKSDAFFITSTSGTTGAPKFLALSYEQVCKRVHAARADYEPFKTVAAPLFNCTARPFLSRALSILLTPCTLIDSNKPSFWLENGVNLVNGSPEQVKDSLSGKKLKQKIATLHIGGGKIEAEVIAELLESFDQVIDVYGASETNRSFMNINRLNEDGIVTTQGKSLDSQVQVVADDGRECDIDEPGTVRVRNDYLADGYLNNPHAQAKAFRDGWFYPGDRARWESNGNLRIEGRVDDVINMGGTKIDAARIEIMLRMAPDVVDAVCFKNPKGKVRTELLAFVVVEPLAQIDICVENARLLCLRNLPPLVVPRHVFPINEIPRDSEGKPDRAACAALILQRSAANGVDQPGTP